MAAPPSCSAGPPSAGCKGAGSACSGLHHVYMKCRSYWDGLGTFDNRFARASCHLLSLLAPLRLTLSMQIDFTARYT
eukprot:1377368-Pleurochrysis_carterae.AAC.2